MRRSRVLSLFRSLKTNAFRVVVLAMLLRLTPDARADTISIANTPFIIPAYSLPGTSLTLFSDGSAPQWTGTDARNPVVFTLPGNTTMTGTMTLNLNFSGFALDEFNRASIAFTVNDLDFFADIITPTITLWETASLNPISGTNLTSPLNLQSKLPVGTTVTDDQIITLQPVTFRPSDPNGYFEAPLILSFTLTSTLVNTGSSAVSLLNTSEALFGNMALTMSRDTGALESTPVPEPSTILLLGMTLLLGAGMAALRNRELKSITRVRPITVA